jgi:hypothetical protein
MTAQLHLAIDALTLQLLLERPQRLVDIIVANDDLHKSRRTSFKSRPKSPGKPGAGPGHPASISQGNEYCSPDALGACGGGPLAACFRHFKARRLARHTMNRLSHGTEAGTNPTTVIGD